MINVIVTIIAIVFLSIVIRSAFEAGKNSKKRK